MMVVLHDKNISNKNDINHSMGNKVIQGGEKNEVENNSRVSGFTTCGFPTKDKK